jgi:undecaprenyl-diphosphatase
MHLPLKIRGIPIIPLDPTEPPGMVVMRALSLLGTPQLIILTGLALALALVWGRRWKEILLLILTVSGGELINVLLKWLFAQPRPSWSHPLLVFSTSSFPSGHAMRSVLFFGLLGYLLRSEMGSWRGRVWTMASGGLVLLIGVSRLYLGAHELIDVLVGYAVGGGWLACAITGVETVQRYRRDDEAPEATVDEGRGGRKTCFLR